MSDVLVSPVIETTTSHQRLVISPCSGRFHPLPPEIFTTEGEWVEPGQVLARVTDGGKTTEVVSSFRGWVMGMLCRPGQPVKPGEALFWIRGA
ncbi:MAG: hypothetical protein ACLGHL_03700 [Actinomycetota bacterium]